MKSSTTAKLSMAAMAALSSVSGMVHDLHAAVVINEVYGGGGSSATTGSYSTDFIEVYNNGTSAVDLTGLTVRYTSAASTTGFVFTSSNTSPVGNVGFLSGTLAPGAFYLVAGATGSSFGGPALPTADATSNIAASGTAGVVGLFANGATDTSGLLDLLGYGVTTRFEGTSTAALTTTSSAARTNGIDTNNNLVDFTIGTPTPRSSAVPEPAALGLAAVGSALVLRRRRQA